MIRRKRTPPSQSPLQPGLVEMAIDIFKSSGFLVVNKTVMKKIGGVNAMVLSNYIDKYQYFREKNERFDGWFFLRHKDIMDQLHFPESTVIKAKKELINLGFIKTRRKGVPAKEWIWISFKNLLSYCFLPVPEGMGGLDPEGMGGLYKETKLKEYNIAPSGKISGLVIPSDFENFMKLYPSKRRGKKSKALVAWEKICKPTFKHRPTWKEVEKAVAAQKESEQWKADGGSYIPLASSWINGYMWLDNPEDLKVYKFNKGRKRDEDDDDQESNSQDTAGSWMGYTGN